MSIIGTFLVKVKDGGSPHAALNLGEFGSAGLMLVASYFIITTMLPESWVSDGMQYTSMGVFWATIAGLVAGLLVGKVTEYYTGTSYRPVKSVALSSTTGHGTNVIQGLAVSMEATAIPALIIVAGILITNSIAGQQ